MLQVTKEYLDNEKNVSDLMVEVKRILKQRKRLYNRYNRKGEKKDVKVPLEYYIVNIASGFFGGKAPIYTVKQEQDQNKKNLVKKLFNKTIGKDDNPEELQMIIDYIRDYNDDASFFYDVVKDYLCVRAGYGIMYETENNEIVYAHSSALQTVALYDYSTPIQMIGLVRLWDEKDGRGNDIEKAEIITADYKRYYLNGKKQANDFKEDIEAKQDVTWKMVPAFAVENVDDLCIFEPVIDLIDAFEEIIKNNKNIFKYNDEAKLKITGYEPEHEMMVPELDENGNPKLDKNEQPILIKNPERVKEDEAILNAKIFYTPGKDGDIDWIIKNINDTASENHKKTLIELILMTTCIPNVTDVGFTNADNASALEKKFFPLEQVLIHADKQFKKELLRMWENIIDRINQKNNSNYDFRNIQIELQRNMPTEKTDVVSMALQLRGLLSDETVIGMLPYDLDVESELAKMKQQTEENMMNNFNNMVALGQEKSNVQNEKKELNKKEQQIDNAKQQIDPVKESKSDNK